MNTRLGVLLFWLAGCIIGLLLPWLAPAPDGRLSWLLDLALHWQWLLLCGLLLGTAIGICFDRRLILATVFAPLPWLTAAPALPSGEATRALQVISANLNLQNRDPASLRAWLDQRQPDLVVLLELSPAYAQALQALPGYPYRELHPLHSPFGMGILSRLPIQNSRLRRDEDGIASLAVEVEVSGCRIRLEAVHPMPPLSPYFLQRRDSGVLEQAERTQRSNLPGLLAGDFNATPWTPLLRQLATLGWRRANGLSATWGGPLGIPIDHILASSHWRLIEREVGPSIGSDHLPIRAELALADDACAAP